MKNKLGKKIFVIYFVILCCIPVGTMKFFSSDLSENRELADFPKFLTQQGVNLSFFDECATYVTDHFSFRAQLVALDSEIKYRLFRSPSDKQVILGKEDWMFFEGSLNDYAGVTLGEEKLESIADHLLEVCSYIEDEGKQPVIMLVPNKASVYPEYMPSIYGKVADVTNLSILQEKMEEKGIPYVDAKAVLLRGKESDEMYLHQDTHWNNTGARLVLNALYEKTGVAYRHTISDYRLSQEHESDLSQILFPTKENLEIQRIYEQNNDFSYQRRVRSMDDLSITSNTQQGVEQRILLFRDSFGRAIIPYLSEVFAQGQYVRSTPYDMSIIKETDCDIVVIEIVERNIADLGEIVVPNERER